MKKKNNDSNYSWEELKKDSKEWKEFQELLQNLIEVQEKLNGIEPFMSAEYYKLEEDYHKIIDNIVNMRAGEIINLAYHNNSFNFDSIVHLDPDTGELLVHHWTSNTYLTDESNLIEIYRLKQNWIGNGCWDDVNDILEDEEWEKLEKKYGNDADFMNEKQLESIGVDLDIRLMDYLRWCIEN